MKWYVYVLRCRDGSLYTGITTNVERRVNEHNKGIGARYTRGRRPVELIWHCGKFGSRSKALKFEAAIKKRSRPEKERLLDMIEEARFDTIYNLVMFGDSRGI